MAYGASDFSGAVATKDTDSIVVTAAVQVVSLLALILLLILFPFGQLDSVDLLWGAAAGLGATLGLTMFYRALALGPMSTAASITAMCSASIPVLYGLFRGIVPGGLSLVGIGLAVPASVLVSVGGVGVHRAVSNLGPREIVGATRGSNQTRMLSILAGIGFGWFFIALSHTSDDGGLFPLLGARAASIIVLFALLIVRRGFERVTGTQTLIIVAAGLLDCAANSLYLLALDGDNFTWVAALSSLYPVSTVLLARGFLKERIFPLQIVGLAMAAGSLVFVSIGQ